MTFAKELIAPQAPPPPVAKPLTITRVVGIFFLCLWALLFAGMIYMMISNWDNDKFFKWGPRYLHGIWVTISLVGTSIVVGAALSLPLAFGRMSKNRIISTAAYLYVYIFRGTPLLAQVFLIYYGIGGFHAELEAIGVWWFFRDAWYCALLSFALNTAAYQAEILRGAIESVPRGQHEAAYALGLSPTASFWKIIMPQALIVALRPYGNEIILMIKGSAIVAIIAVFDLMGETKYAFSRTFDYQSYLWAAIFYLVIVEVLRNVWARLDRRLTRHLQR